MWCQKANEKHISPDGDISCWRGLMVHHNGECFSSRRTMIKGVSRRRCNWIMKIFLAHSLVIPLVSRNTRLPCFIRSDAGEFPAESMCTQEKISRDLITSAAAPHYLTQFPFRQQFSAVPSSIIKSHCRVRSRPRLHQQSHQRKETG